MKSKFVNTIYGSIVGDAVGVPVKLLSREFLIENPITDMIGNGIYNQPMGTWSAASSMTLCLADSIGYLRRVDYDDILKRFALWVYNKNYISDSFAFDYGTCSSAVDRYMRGEDPVWCGGHKLHTNGNGALTHFSPIPLYLFSKYGKKAMEKTECFDICHYVSNLTNAHPISFIGCDIYTSFIIEILSGVKKSELQNAVFSKVNDYFKETSSDKEYFLKYERIFRTDFNNFNSTEIRSSGYVVDTLEAAIWCFLTTDNYRDCILKAVNLGYDTNSIACVAGSLAGSYYEDIPEKWINAIRNKELVDRVIKDFLCSCEH